MSDPQNAIPTWDARGVLPPFQGDSNAAAAIRSPYKLTVEEFAATFASTPERWQIFDGFLDFRAALYAAGVLEGFQWINGSYTENIELISKRAPRDIDVVTFLSASEAEVENMTSKAPIDLTNRAAVKSAFSVDNYFTMLGLEGDESFVHRVAYWHSLWSHRRNRIWKGYVHVSLDQRADQQLSASLASSEAGGTYGQLPG